MSEFPTMQDLVWAARQRLPNAVWEFVTYGSETETTLRHISPDLLHMEQYMDFLRNRMFRQTLLCHDSVALDC